MNNHPKKQTIKERGGDICALAVIPVAAAQ
jgi:hypothetical protein